MGQSCRVIRRICVTIVLGLICCSFAQADVTYRKKHNTETGRGDWIVDGASLTLGNLTDVDTTGIATGKVPKWNDVTSKWEMGDDEGGAEGVGDVLSVGDCTGGACFDGTSDGGTYLSLYDAQGATKFQVGDNAGAITLTLPTTTGTLPTFGDLLESIIFKFKSFGQTLAAGANTYEQVPSNCTVTSWEVTGDTGSTVIDILKSDYATMGTWTSIAGTEIPNTTAAVKGTDTSLTTWNTTLEAGQYLMANITSSDVTGNAKVVLKMKRR